MSLTQSTMADLDIKASYFKLKDTNNNKVSIDDFNDKNVLLVVFMCNHCPFVKHIRNEFLKFIDDYQDKSLAVVGINSNDQSINPDDSFEHMITDAKTYNYKFPYLYDETQEVAKSYKAACTPDFFLFDKERKLRYRGQFDDSRPGNNIPITGKDLRNAVDMLLANKNITKDQKPSMGCNIKWKQGNEPDYFL